MARAQTIFLSATPTNVCCCARCDVRGRVSRTHFPASAYARASAAGLRARAAKWRRPWPGAPQGRRWAQVPFFNFWSSLCCRIAYLHPSTRRSHRSWLRPFISWLCVLALPLKCESTIHQLVVRHVLTRPLNIWFDEKHRIHYYMLDP